ncbi:aminotransferase class IV [Paenibacillus sp. IHBB 10380]|uniref:aminotransferase class IV n=1 Tax=Paenibacillus sp. IHBB 10380 TaxID=1566358 RepID=UPI0005CFCD0A|nr:aminotransferase class IV [Paenibacillus sp. IHBB 10380]AJS60759.1 4-amino-4-deoxychorismate lyase [Paenibacillus sp. IHBB 10380]
MTFVGKNHSIVEAKDAVVSVMDHGFLYGMGLFETFRTYQGNPFLLDRHLTRLSEGCRLLGIPYKVDIERTLTWIRAVMQANGLQEAYIRYTVSAGEDVLGLPTGDYNNPNHFLTVKELPVPSADLYRSGKGLQQLSTPRNTPETSERLKSLHYMNNILAKRELSSYPEATKVQAEGLMLTDKGYVAEGIVSNVVMVRGGTIYTPALSTGILPGITRAVVMELAVEEGIRCEEGLYTWDDLLGAEEIWMTSSIQELVPITSLLGLNGSCHRVGNGTAGPITMKLLHLYRQKAGIYE